MGVVTGHGPAGTSGEPISPSAMVSPLRSRLQNFRVGLARPNSTAQGTCALEDVGGRGLTGVADPTGVCSVRSPTVAAGVPCLVGREEAMGWLVRRWKASQAGLGQGDWACGKYHGAGVAAGR